MPSYAQIQERIALLKAQEKAEVIRSIKAAIEQYGITAQELFRTKAPTRRPTRSKIRFRDGTGNTWSGRGRRPQWFVNALAKGKSYSELAAR
jgi:DNA-binding protein H-NS